VTCLCGIPLQLKISDRDGKEDFDEEESGPYTFLSILFRLNTPNVTCGSKGQVPNDAYLCHFCCRVIEKSYPFMGCEKAKSVYHTSGGFQVCFGCYHELMVPEFWVEGQTRRVGIRVVVTRLFDVSTVTQSFRARILLECQWLPSEADLKVSCFVFGFCALFAFFLLSVLFFFLFCPFVCSFLLVFTLFFTSSVLLLWFFNCFFETCSLVCLSHW